MDYNSFTAIIMQQLHTIIGRFMFLGLLLTALACGRKTAEEQPSDTVSSADTNTTVIKTQPPEAHLAEMAEYRSPALKGYQLYAVYPFEDAPVYLLIDAGGKGRILSLNLDKQPLEGTALTDDEFTAVVALGQKENPSGIASFEKIKLVKKDGSAVEFMQVMVKRNLTFGDVYAYQQGEATGDLKLSLRENATMSFAARASTGAPDHHICELQGLMAYKANLAYYQDEPAGVTCKVLFLFNDQTVDVFTVSGNIDCGCAPNVTLNGQYMKK